MSEKRKALGKGLAALIPSPTTPRPHAPVPGKGGEALVPLSLIDPNPSQPRTRLRPEALDQLARSIEESGVVQPILLRPVENGRYQIIAGERRFRAAQKIGLATIPAVVRSVDDDRVLEFALVENIQREELTPIEEALALKKLQEELSLTQEALAAKVGKERVTVANTLRLLRLPAEIKEEIHNGRLSAGHARALLSVDDPKAQRALAAVAIKHGLSVRQIEARANAEGKAKATKGRKTDANTRAAEESLRARLGSRVEIHRRRGKGEIRIAFDNEAELNRLYSWILKG